jgi:hypothetical protein
MHEAIADSVRASLPHGSRLLSFGAGTGEECRRLPQYTFTAFEPSEAMRAVGMQRTADLPSAVWEDPNGSYAGVLSVLVAHFQPEFSLESLRQWTCGPIWLASMVEPEDEAELEVWKQHVRHSITGASPDGKVDSLWQQIRTKCCLRRSSAYGSGRQIFRRPLIRVTVTPSSGR